MKGKGTFASRCSSSFNKKSLLAATDFSSRARPDGERQVSNKEEARSLFQPGMRALSLQTGTSPCKLLNSGGLELVVLNRMDITTLGDEERLASHVKHVSEVGA